MLLLADGVTITDIAAFVGMSRRHVYRWIQQLVQEGVAGLADKPTGRYRREPRLSKRSAQNDVDTAS
jgi:transposase